MAIGEKLYIAVGFGKRKSQIGQGEWHAMARYAENQWVSPSPQLRVDTQNWGDISGKWEIAISEASAVRANFGGITEVKKVSVSRQNRLVE